VRIVSEFGISFAVLPVEQILLPFLRTHDCGIQVFITTGNLSMNGSWHLGKLAGVDLRIHWTFLLLPAWIYFSSLIGGSGFAAATSAVLFILAIFVCVVLHELGHALMARQFGIGTVDITLLPIGGVARLLRMPRNPLQEFLIAVAGPLVNVLIAAAVFIGLALAGQSAPTMAVSQFLIQLGWVNVGLVVFNMIPAFPMDGGRVLRATLAMFMPYAHATNTAAVVGQVGAVGFGLLGFLSGNPMLMLIAVFIFFAAKGEISLVNQRESQFPDAQNSSSFVEDEDYVIDTSTRPALDAEWSAESTFRWIANQTLAEYPVKKRGAIIGYVTRTDILRAIASGWGSWPIERLLFMRFENVRDRHSASV
jgi:Zn-dependent protease